MNWFDFPDSLMIDLNQYQDICSTQQLGSDIQETIPCLERNPH